MMGWVWLEVIAPGEGAARVGEHTAQVQVLERPRLVEGVVGPPEDLVHLGSASPARGVADQLAGTIEHHDFERAGAIQLVQCNAPGLLCYVVR